jgi:signal transduction histidine kinase
MTPNETPTEEQVSILVVDDQNDGLVAFDAILHPLGQRLVRVRSGREALRALLKEDFALILMDVVMPEMDGFETARVIRSRERCKDTPIIFVTALHRGEMPSFEAYSLGAVDYILKPIEPDILRTKVSVFVELARKRLLIERQAEALRKAERQQYDLALADALRRAEEERSRAREALLRREVEIMNDEARWLEGVLNALPTPLVMLEPGSGRALFVNDAARSFPWRTAEEQPEVEFSDRDRQPLTREQLPAMRAAAGERLSGMHVRWRCGAKEGSFLAFSEELPSRFGHATTALMTMLDVTQLTHIEESLQAAVQIREAFLSVASHELKTPLTSLTLHVQRLRRAQARGQALTSLGDGKDPLVLVDRATGRLHKLVDELLDVSRISAGKLEMELETVDFSAVLRDIAAEMRDDLARAGCALDLEIEDSVTGLWDRTRLEQVVVNLVGNAVKYAAGKPIAIRLRYEGDNATLTVRDEGIGIAPEDHARVFQRFERAASDREYGGLGLGLWIAREIVEGLGGRITLDSALGRGSTFTVILPRGAAEESRQRTMPSAELHASA